MTEQDPPAYLTNDSHGAKLMRQVHQFFAGVGSAGGNLQWPGGGSALGSPVNISNDGRSGVVLRPTALKVSYVSGTTVRVAAGAGVVGGSRAADQGSYFVMNNGSEDIVLSARPGTTGQSRYDTIIARVYDSEHGAGSDTWALEKLEGTPGTSPSKVTLAGTHDAMILAYVTVPNSGSITVEDVRHVACLDDNPIGTVIDWMGATLPHGYLPCDGDTWLVADFPDLFEVIGYVYGGASTTFNTPDLRGRVGVGVDNMVAIGSGQGDAGRLAAANTIGGTGGSETQTLTQANLPATVTEEVYYNGANDAAGQWSGESTGGTGGGAPSHASAVIPLGSGTAHNNLQPYMLTNKIIRAY